MADITIPSIEQVQQLPMYHRQIIPPEYRDEMGHMNVRWYLSLFDEGGWAFFDDLGMTRAYYAANDAGAFALKQFIHYLAEVHIGETVAVHMRVLGRSARRIHSMGYLVNETTGRIAATIEELGSHADLSTRRTSAFPEQIAAQIDARLARDQALSWASQTSGVIQP